MLNFSLLTQPKVIEYSRVQLKDYDFIPTAKHHQRINELCSELSKIKGIKYFSLTITNHYIKPLCFSNMVDWAIAYHTNGLNLCDVAIAPPESSNKFILTDQLKKNYISTLFYNCFEVYGIYEAYSIIRSCDDLKIIAIAHSDEPISSFQSFYENSNVAFEDFTLHFIEEVIDLIIEHRNVLAMSRFIIDKEYRHDVIKGKYFFEVPTLSMREQQILNLIFHGHTAKEIAKYLSITYRTVQKYEENLKRKLHARNATQSLKRALDLGLVRNYS